MLLLSILQNEITHINKNNAFKQNNLTFKFTLEKPSLGKLHEQDNFDCFLLIILTKWKYIL